MVSPISKRFLLYTNADMSSLEGRTYDKPPVHPNNIGFTNGAVPTCRASNVIDSLTLQDKGCGDNSIQVWIILHIDRVQLHALADGAGGCVQIAVASCGGYGVAFTSCMGTNTQSCGGCGVVWVRAKLQVFGLNAR